ncbi:phospholipid/glycerol acyltransferase [Emticicia oligotrophica DSM 17448]|uniref:Phospholipid/glycerol acyltransferase n=1 Tax=Emticicia oligotrophica (strain DSM 17448 / CIP 109782 / MTCC 6937 / GPTSA100-15) TaxID=929562 RepID=A0ABM5N0I0_EMTOG|nr:1-acyl-sn-glycerol-3-phosphate acyltransferase [Emticicia oligotrophica]AFK02905.1 phospholipid/glycerol acyltransferase [Emticicia oligotrophica DSM 17448]
MLYYILRPYVTFLLKFFIKRIKITGIENIPKTGAVMLASTHANSFFDAVLLCCTLDRRVWSLARGDVFKKNLAKKALSSLFMMPVHRLSEGKEHLGNNDDTFKKCIELFKQGEIVLIFSEGLCTNQTKLLPLKKGTGRLAQQAWLDGLDLKVIPVAITYNNFKSFGKIINLSFGEAIPKAELPNPTEDGVFLRRFNEILSEKLNQSLNWNFPKLSPLQTPFFTLGYILHFPAIGLATFISKKLTKGTVFFDSITIGLMIVLIPLYWLIVFFVVRTFGLL